MTYDEFTKWQTYFELRPIEWRDDSRFMKILQSLGVKESAGRLFESLAQIEKAEKERAVRNEMMQGLKASVMFRHLMGAVGGDKLRILEEL